MPRLQPGQRSPNRPSSPESAGLAAGRRPTSRHGTEVDFAAITAGARCVPQEGVEGEPRRSKSMTAYGYRLRAAGWRVLMVVPVAAGLALMGPATAMGPVSAAQVQPILPVPPVPPRPPEPPLVGTGVCWAPCPSALPVPARPEPPQPPVEANLPAGPTLGDGGTRIPTSATPLTSEDAAAPGPGRHGAGSPPNCSTCAALGGAPGLPSAPVPISMRVAGPVPPLPPLADTGTPLNAVLAGLLLLLGGAALWLRQQRS